MSLISRHVLHALTLWICTLAPIGSSSVLGLNSSSALAQDTVNRLDLIPPGEVIGDGSTEVKLNFIGMKKDGSPAVGMSAKVAFSDGSGGARLTETGDGLYLLKWTPMKVDETSQTTLTMKIKVPGENSFEQRWTVRVVPPLGEDVTVESNPSTITLGQDGSSTLSIQLSDEALSTARESDLVVWTSAGSVTNLTGLGNGKFTALYTPPNDRHPHTALVTVADRRDPSRTYGALALPLVGKVNFPVNGPPNAKLLIEIGDRTFGPMQADASGVARIPIIVPPGRPDAKVIAVTDGERTEQPLDLMVPDSRRVQLFPMHQSVPADPEAQIELRAYIVTPEGLPDNSARIQFNVTTGAVGTPQRISEGVYAATFTPPQGNRNTQATVQVSLIGVDNQTDAHTLNLIPIRPSQLNINSDPAVLGKSTRDFRLSSRLTGPDGVGISGRQLDFRVAGATVNGNTRDMGGGDYVTKFSTTGDGPVEIVATVKAPASGNPLRKILVFPMRDKITNDGRTTTMVTVMTLDEFGYPVTGVPVALSVSHGDGSLPAMVTTDGSGIAQVRYTAGHSQGIAHISASSNGVSGAAGILQMAENAIFDPTLPSSGTGASISTRKTWNALVAPHRIEREGQVGASVSAEEAAESAGAITRLTLQASPEVIGPGGTVTLRAKATDPTGRGASGRKLEFWVKPSGVFGAVTDLGGGEYEVTLTVDDNATGEVKVSVQAPETTVSAFVAIPVAGTAIEETPEETTPEETPEVVKEPRPQMEVPPMRLSVAYEGGLYSYRQSPATSNGPMYNKVITVGGGVTPAAGAAGLRIGATAAVPGMDWLSIDGNFRVTYWSMEIGEGFDEPVSDALHDIGLVARIQREFIVGDTRLRPGLVLGASINDFIVYKLIQEDGLPFIEHDQLVVPGLRTGLRLGTDFGALQVDSGIDVDTNTAVTGTGGHVTLHYSITDTWGAQAHMGFLNRATDVYSNTEDGEKRRVGSLEDGYSYGGIGVTWTP